MFRYLLLPLAIVLPVSCADGLCGNQILQTVPSPDGRYAAVVFERDCGATTAASFQVSILPAGQAPSGAGNVFISEPGLGLPNAPNEPVVEVAWSGSHRLRVRYRLDDEIFKQVDEREGVQIEYFRGDP